jgi:hypothetical protein
LGDGTRGARRDGAREDKTRDENPMKSQIHSVDPVLARRASYIERLPIGEREEYERLAASLAKASKQCAQRWIFPDDRFFLLCLAVLP